MGTSFVFLAFASSALVWARVSSSGCRWEPIRLSFTGIRGGQQPPASPQLFPDSPCGGEKTRLTCSEGRYPDDFICNAGLMSEEPNWEGRSRISDIQVQYRHETVENTTCTAYFNAEGNDGTNFEFARRVCSKDTPDETVPHFWMSKISSLTIAAAPESTSNGGCMCSAKYFYFAREEVQEEQSGGLGIPPTPVRFIQNSYLCTQTCGHFVFGRTSSTTYTHDGRRNRPIPRDD